MKVQPVTHSANISQPKHAAPGSRNVWFDRVLVTWFFVDIVVVAHTFWHEPSHGRIVLALIVALHFAEKISNACADRIGAFLARVFRRLDEPLRDQLSKQIWRHHCFDFAVHVAMVAFELVVLRDETWWQDTKTCWNQGSTDGTFPEHRFRTRMLYFTQIALWTSTGFSCRFLEEYRRGYEQHMSHHVVTIALVIWSYALNFLPVGVVVLFLHDVSNLPVDMYKMAKLLHLRGARGCYISNLLFGLIVLDWGYFRVFLYPAKLLKTTLIENRESCMPMDAAHDWTNWHPCIPSWALFNGLLIGLFCIQLFWWNAMFRPVLAGVERKFHSVKTAA